MDLNYTAFFLISFLPLFMAYFYYDSRRLDIKKIGIASIQNFTILKKIFLFFASGSLVYVYINLVIHQFGFYELFFTDIMKGDDSAKVIVNEFMALYGGKHRSLGHGSFHGFINALIIWLPVIGSYCILTDKSWLHFKVHFIYALITSVVISGLIAAFV